MVWRRVGTVGLSLAIVAALVPLSGASAAEGDADRGFPELDFEWYVTAPPFAYPSISTPAAGEDLTLVDDGIRVSYFGANGSAPMRGQGDISLSIALPYNEPSASDQVDIDTAQLRDMQIDMGTRLIDGLALPQQTEYEVTGATISTPEIEWADGVLSIIRPPIPTMCSATDINQYSFQIAALGDNGSKYLVDVDVIFGKRSAAATNARNCSAPTTKPDSTTTPGASVAPSQEATDEPEPEPAGTQDGAAQSEEAAAGSDLSWALWPLGGVVVAGYLAYLIRKRFRPSREIHALDGTPLSTNAPPKNRNKTDEDE